MVLGFPKKGLRISVSRFMLREQKKGEIQSYVMMVTEVMMLV
jgi:hypothetical protein